MHAIPARDIPKTARYVTLELPGKGAHAFRLPTFGVIDQLTGWAIERLAAVVPPVSPEVLAAYQEALAAHTEGPPPEMPRVKVAANYIAVHEVVSAALVGAAWYGRGTALDTVLDLDNLAAYGAAVADELQDRDYTYAEIAQLGDQLRHAMIVYFNAGMAIKTEAIAAGKDSPA